MELAWCRNRSAAAVMMSVAVTGLVAACGASGHSSGAAAPASKPSPAKTASSAPAAAVVSSANSCSVVTQSEASAALGQPVKAPLLGKATVEGGIACVFYGPDVPPGTSPDIGVPDSVRVVLVTGADARKWFNNYRAKVHAQPVSGLGDQAYYDGYASISVLQGDAYVRIAVGIPDNLSVEETLARDALPRM
jgi:lipopolysaccharide export system protein LptA